VNKSTAPATVLAALSGAGRGRGTD